MLEPHLKRLADDGVVTLNIRARPNARVTKIVGVLGDGSVKIDVHAAPEDGEANLELLKFLAKAFGISVSNVTLLSGHTGRIKVVRIAKG